MTLADFLPVAEEVPEFIAGLLVLALALFVLGVRFDSKLNRAFALHLVLVGSYLVWASLDDTPRLQTTASAMWPYFALASPFALVHFALRFREVQGERAAPRWVGPALLGAATLLALAYGLDHSLIRATAAQGRVAGPLVPFTMAGLGGLAASFAALAFARTARRTAQGEAQVGLVLAAVAFLVVNLHASTKDIVRFAAGVSDWSKSGIYGSAALLVHSAGAVVGVAALGVLIRNSAAPSSRRILGVMGLSVASGLVIAMMFVLGLPSRMVAFQIVGGLWSVAYALLLTYAVLRGQLLGIDVKVRFAISKSTVAAVFVAVFFIASETAQQFFGDTLGSTYIGIGAAGMLVFAMAPLQRLAERLAERAVPVAPAPSPTSDSTSERDHYCVLLRRFLADGRMTRDEERALARVATLAGMTPDDTLAARHEVQAEIEGVERA